MSLFKNKAILKISLAKMPCSFWTKLTILGHSGSVRRTSTMTYATVNRYKKHPISPGDLNIPSFEIPFIDSESVSPLTGFEKDPLPLQSGILLPFLDTVFPHIVSALE